ncbi:MAG TPA: hypothetical protein VGO18_29640, partial [Steroidobacteraceae bacterium]|nr:hypothetical protein [Steroidobacteraceae bacterium]
MNACSARSHDRVSAALAALVVMGSTAIMALMPIPVRAASAPSAASQAAENSAATPSAGAATATVLEINGAIGPATSRYVTKALDGARANGSRIVVLQIDTPGGLDTS